MENCSYQTAINQLLDFYYNDVIQIMTCPRKLPISIDWFLVNQKEVHFRLEILKMTLKNLRHSMILCLSVLFNLFEGDCLYKLMLIQSSCTTLCYLDSVLLLFNCCCCCLSLSIFPPNSIYE